MLDVTVHKGDAYKQRGVLDVKPYSKPSEQKIPLGSNSNHPDSVHRSWPVAEIHRIRLRSSSYSAFETAKESMLQKFSRFGLSEAVVERAAQVEFYPTCIPRPPQTVKTFWLRLPFHGALLHSSLGSVLRETAERWSPHVLQALRRPVGIRIAWQRSGPSLRGQAQQRWR